MASIQQLQAVASKDIVLKDTVHVHHEDNNSARVAISRARVPASSSPGSFDHEAFAIKGCLFHVHVRFG